MSEVPRNLSESRVGAWRAGRSSEGRGLGPRSRRNDEEPAKGGNCRDKQRHMKIDSKLPAMLELSMYMCTTTCGPCLESRRRSSWRFLSGKALSPISTGTRDTPF